MSTVLLLLTLSLVAMSTIAAPSDAAACTCGGSPVQFYWDESEPVIEIPENFGGFAAVGIGPDNSHWELRLERQGPQGWEPANFTMTKVDGVTFIAPELFAQGDQLRTAVKRATGEEPDVWKELLVTEAVNVEGEVSLELSEPYELVVGYPSPACGDPYYAGLGSDLDVLLPPALEPYRHMLRYDVEANGSAWDPVGFCAYTLLPGRSRHGIGADRLSVSCMDPAESEEVPDLDAGVVEAQVTVTLPGPAFDPWTSPIAVVDLSCERCLTEQSGKPVGCAPASAGSDAGTTGNNDTGNGAASPDMGNNATGDMGSGSDRGGCSTVSANADGAFGLLLALLLMRRRRASDLLVVGVLLGIRRRTNGA